MLLLGMLPKAALVTIFVFVYLRICVSAMEFPTCFLMLPPHLESLVIICLSSHFLCGKNQFLLSGRNFIRISLLAARFLFEAARPRIVTLESFSLAQHHCLFWNQMDYNDQHRITPRGGVS